MRCGIAFRWRSQTSYSGQNSGIFLYHTHSGTSLWMYIHAHYPCIAFLLFKEETSFRWTRTKFWHCNSSSKSNAYGLMSPFTSAVHSAFRFMYRWFQTNSSDEHFLPKTCWGFLVLYFLGVESKPAALPFHPLIQSDSAHSMWQHTHSSSPETKRNNNNKTASCWSTFGKLKCSKMVTMLKYSPLYLCKWNHPNVLLQQPDTCLKQRSTQGKQK